MVLFGQQWFVCKQHLCVWGQLEERDICGWCDSDADVYMDREYIHGYVA